MTDLNGDGSYDGPLFPDPHDDGGPVFDEDPYDTGDYPILSWVTIDSITAPCDPDQLRVGQPTILDGLSFGWGRDTTVDQPSANTCAFTLREQLEPRDAGINQVDDPTFEDPELNASRFPADWVIDGGQVTIAPNAGIINQAYDPSFATADGISPGGSANNQVGGTVNGFPVPKFGNTCLSIAQSVDGTDTTLLYPTAYVQNNNTSGSGRPSSPPIEPGKTYNLSIYVNAPAGGTKTNGNALRLNVVQAFNDGTANDTSWVTDQAPADGQWHRISGTYTVPTNSARVNIRLIANYVGADPITGSKIRTFWDGLQITEGPDLLPYRDADTLPTTDEEILATNLVSDPGVEYGTQGWATTNANRSIERSTAKPHTGSYSMKITTLADSGSPYAGELYGGGSTAESLGLKNGDQITMSGWVWQETQATTYQARVWIGGTSVTAKSVSATAFGQWQFLTVTNTIVDATGTFACRLYLPVGAGIVTWADDMGVTVGTSPADFNGDTPASGGVSYRWTGTPGNSSSEQYIPATPLPNADSYRVWLIGDRLASTSTPGPPAPAPDNGAIPVVAGQTLHMAITVSASVADREVRWQIARYRDDGSIITSTTYVASNTKVPGPNQPMRFEAEYTIPDDGTAYIAVAFVPEGTFGGSLTFSDPDFYFTGGSDALDVIHVGSQVEIWTRADLPTPDAEVSDPLMFYNNGAGDLDVSRWTRIAGDQPSTFVWVGKTTATGARDSYVQLYRDNDWDWTTTVTFPPTPFDTVGDQPTSWDLVARLAPGGTWHASMDVRLPPGVKANLKAYAYTGPEKADRAGEATVTGAAATATGSLDQFTRPWDGDAYLERVTLEGDVTLPADLTDPAGYWISIGIELVSMPSPTAWNDPAVADLTWNDITLRWVDLQRAYVYAPILLQAENTIRTALIWSGEVTNLRAQAAGDDAYTMNVTASDLSSVMANVKVGDEPWPKESLGSRANKIMALIPEAPPLQIDDTLEATQIAYRDVDSQPPLGLLQDLAQSAGGVFWITAHASQGAYLWMEDPRNREAVRRFVIDPTTKNVSITTGNDPTAGVAVISAMDILRDPVNWTQDTSQVITQVSVTWREEIPPEEQGGQTTTEDHTVIVRDTQAVIDLYGVRDLSIDTELTTEADAEELAALILAQSRGVPWRADGLEYDTLLLVRDIATVDYARRLSIVMDLLDATTRIGYAFTMVDMPEWTPAGAVRSMYVEGGTYTWEGNRWHLSMIATPAAGQGESARWQDFNGTGVTWDNFRPNKIKWIDAYGTAGPIVSTPLQDQLQEAHDG